MVEWCSSLNKCFGRKKGKMGRERERERKGKKEKGEGRDGRREEKRRDVSVEGMAEPLVLNM